MTSKLCFLLLSVCLPGLSGQSLESIPSSPVIKKPGETLSISCKGSGYTFGNHAVHWVRQPTAKGLEWIGRVRTDTGEATYANSFSGNLEITKDNAQSMSFLKLSGLRAEDSAVYYCARQAQ
uniref:Ig-like domain-containing protein n=1 Tax=Esox lucius TaxID=8010 RepID=A0A3P9ANS3_ESOLU